MSSTLNPSTASSSISSTDSIQFSKSNDRQPPKPQLVPSQTRQQTPSTFSFFPSLYPLSLTSRIASLQLYQSYQNSLPSLMCVEKGDQEKNGIKRIYKSIKSTFQNHSTTTKDMNVGQLQSYDERLKNANVIITELQMNIPKLQVMINENLNLWNSLGHNIIVSSELMISIIHNESKDKDNLTLKCLKQVGETLYKGGEGEGSSNEQNDLKIIENEIDELIIKLSQTRNLLVMNIKLWKNRLYYSKKLDSLIYYEDEKKYDLNKQLRNEQKYLNSIRESDLMMKKMEEKLQLVVTKKNCILGGIEKYFIRMQSLYLNHRIMRGVTIATNRDDEIIEKMTKLDDKFRTHLESLKNKHENASENENDNDNLLFSDHHEAQNNSTIGSTQGIDVTNSHTQNVSRKSNNTANNMIHMEEEDEELLLQQQYNEMTNNSNSKHASSSSVRMELDQGPWYKARGELGIGIGIGTGIGTGSGSANGCASSSSESSSDDVNKPGGRHQVRQRGGHVEFKLDDGGGLGGRKVNWGTGSQESNANETNVGIENKRGAFDIAMDNATRGGHNESCASPLYPIV